ncbi:MAG TPA: hypothetical protein VFI23_02140 [Rhizomicrobium sp.]|nr:hypothetical protein [Rhizomicrobium sp.]
MIALKSPQKYTLFLLTVVTFCVIWHYFGIWVAQAIWPLLSEKNPSFELAVFLQAAAFLFGVQVVVGFLVSWLLGLWKNTSSGKALLLVSVCLILPLAVNNDLALFSPTRTVFVTAGPQK